MAFGRRCKKPDDVLFINAEHYAKGKRQNQLTAEHIEKIVQTYQLREEEPRYSRRVEMAEIEIDLAATHEQLVAIEEEIQKAKERHNGFIEELGLASLP